MTVKIAVIGGGSSMFVPGLVRRLLEIPCFEGAELRLMDVDAQRVGVMEKLANELAAAENRKLSVTATTERTAALRGADFVIVAVSVGGMAAWGTDIEIPAKHGVFMHIADSIGPGGIFRALRNTPIVASVARDLEELSPDALVLNYTNPASANVIAMAKSSSVRSLSLCSCSPYPYRADWLEDLVGVPVDEIVKPSYVGGINHCTGIFALKLKDGRDAMPIVRERTSDEVTRWAIDTFGVIPYCWTHWVEFFPQLQRLEEPYTGRAQVSRCVMAARSTTWTFSKSASVSGSGSPRSGRRTRVRTDSQTFPTAPKTRASWWPKSSNRWSMTATSDSSST